MKVPRPVTGDAAYPGAATGLLKKIMRAGCLVLSYLLITLASFNCNEYDGSPDHTFSGLLPAAAAAALPLKPAASSPENWMSTLPDSLNLSHLSIPGTHDAGACYEPVAGIAKCQNLHISSQLNIGVRFLDIRCRHVKNAFVIHHGPISQNQRFEDIIKVCRQFLQQHPGECVIMSVKEEYVPDHCNRSFAETFSSYVQQYPALWYLGETVPSLKEARGKIVLLRRFNAAQPLGIDASGWKMNNTFSIANHKASLRIEDDFIVPDTKSKWRSLCNFFDEAKRANDNTLYICFTSGYKPLLFRIPNITAVSRAINSSIATYFSSNTRGRFGIIPMDFADPGRVRLIINTNF